MRLPVPADASTFSSPLGGGSLNPTIRGDEAGHLERMPPWRVPYKTAMDYAVGDGVGCEN